MLLYIARQGGLNVFEGGIYMMVCPPAWAACSLACTSSFTLKYLDTHLQHIV